jgi:hypothetical protein
MNRSRILLVAILIGVATYWYYDNQKREEDIRRRHEETLAAIRNAAENKNTIDALARNPAVPDRPDVALQMLPPGYHRTASAWDSAERRRIQALFPANFNDS